MVEYLLHAGHDLNTLMGMTYKQMTLFAELAADRRVTELAAEASLVRIAFHADKKQYEKFIDGLNDDG